MRRRRARQNAIGWALLVLISTPVLGSTRGFAQVGSAEGLEVGSISDLDLEAVRIIIDRSDDRVSPDVKGLRSLSLEEAVALSLEENLGLQVSMRTNEIAEAAVTASKSKFHPLLEVSGGAAGTKRGYPDSNRQSQFTDNQDVIIGVRQEVPTGGSVTVGVGYARSFTDENYTQTDGSITRNLETSNEIGGVGIEISQPLLRGGRIFVARKEILDAEYDTEISRAELRSQILSVTAKTKTAYYKVIQTLRAIEVIEEALVRDAQLVEASRALFESGRVSKVDVYSAEINQANDMARLAGAEANRELAQNELREVLGLPIDTEVDVTDTTIPFDPVQIELESWIRQAVERRPELVRAKIEIEKAELAVRVRKNDALPSFDVGGGFEPGFDGASWNWNARGEFRYPIGNVGARSRLKQATTDRSRLNTEYARLKRQVELEVREIEIRLRQTLEQLRNLILGVENARAKRKIARGRFEMGLADNLDIRNADEELIQTETALLDGLVGYASNLALLEARIGGTVPE
ncbi:MAG: hypothetical protein CMN75_09560 [Spirochaeta sp.]|nr:hypothetical protein [Spirochaeta sp.]RPG08033.1 MAG: TolC family protein [Proteobacteria bacterium TMED72]